MVQGIVHTTRHLHLAGITGSGDEAIRLVDHGRPDATVIGSRRAGCSPPGDWRRSVALIAPGFTRGDAVGGASRLRLSNQRSARYS